ncbi:MAG: molybdenum ABC transporter ATP-binding protein [Hyphomicrobium sp.]|jgi:molybdate transport system ATP-binding protein
MIVFDCTLVRKGFTLDVAFESPGGVLALFGPSGSGKSTILRLIAGLDRPDRGHIVIGGQMLVDTAAGCLLPAHKRRTGLVFQDGNLFPHLTVRQNLNYGRRFMQSEKPLIGFDAVLSLLDIERLVDRNPVTLSGGERQRVAIGRALLASPGILLLDEPLASLDTARKLEILPFIERLRDEVSLPIVYVSHSIEEVARLATTVVHIEDGKVVASGSPASVLAPRFDEGANRFQAVTMLTGTVARHLPEFSVTVLDHPAGEIVVPSSIDRPRGSRMRLAVHATNVALALRRPTGMSVRTQLSGRVVKVDTGAGPMALITVELAGGDQISAFATRLALSELAITPGVPVFALVKAVSIDELSVTGQLPKK